MIDNRALSLDITHHIKIVRERKSINYVGGDLKGLPQNKMTPLFYYIL